MANTDSRTKTKAARPKAAASEAKAQAAVPAVAEGPSALDRRRMVTGTVVSDKMQKTIVVKVDRRVRHALYKKYVMRSRRFKAHDEKNDARAGDLVQLVETRPMSREKRWALKAILRRAAQVAQINV